VLLKHLATGIDDQATATLFYLVGMGFTRDPDLDLDPNTMRVNVGEQQIHLPARTPQVLSGHTGIVVPDPRALVGRLESVKGVLRGTQFAYTVENDHLSVMTPWGNELRCYAPSPRFGDVLSGIPYVEVLTRRGTADGIARFYQQAMCAPASIEHDGGDAIAHIRIGTHQWLAFRESDAQIHPCDGYHIAVYVANVSGPFAWLDARGLVTDGIHNHQVRIQEIVDPDTGDHLTTVEHEIRSLFHPLYRRPPVNRDAG
jgi:hypothetical protein